MRRVGRVIIIMLIVGVAGGLMWWYAVWNPGHGTETMRQNVYILENREDVVLVLFEGKKQEYKIKGRNKKSTYTGIADLYLKGDTVIRMVCKPEIIKGRILAVGENTMDVEQYGSLPLHQGCGYYLKKNGISPGNSEDLYVGENQVEFVVAEGAICAILYEEEGEEKKEEKPTGETIRVAIKTDGFQGYEHEKIVLCGTTQITVKTGKEQKRFEAGEPVEFTMESMKEKRSTITGQEGGRIQVMSLKRNQGNPSYRGRMEVVKGEHGLHLMNEVELEQYLYGVLPSEMPAGYEKEALKAQAVCARSYALRHKKNNRLKEMGAHVDDSVSYQVYNNTTEDERCNVAVDETKGQELYYQGKVAATYFYSTSCGVTTSSQDVTFTQEEVPYLQGKLQEKVLPEEKDSGEARLVSGMLGEEELFSKYLTEDRDVLEKGESWYRWNTCISLKDMEHQINSQIAGRCEAVPDKILVRQQDGSYKSQKIDTIGTLKRVVIKKRGSGGVVTMAVLVGSEATVRVYAEYNIRLMLFSENAIIEKQDGSRVTGLSLLPSGFFVVERNGSVYHIKGGGFGHGTGMSQTGANELAKLGKNYTQILSYYFEGASVSKDK